MTKRWNRFVRRSGPALGAGLLLQTNGCSIDSEVLAQLVVSTIVDNLVTSFLFSLLGTPGAGI